MSMDKFQYDVKVPKERIAVIIGEKGEKKRELEADLGVKLAIDSEEGDVFITGKDAIAWIAEGVAAGAGMQLEDEEVGGGVHVELVAGGPGQGHLAQASLADKALCQGVIGCGQVDGLDSPSRVEGN